MLIWFRSMRLFPAESVALSSPRHQDTIPCGGWMQFAKSGIGAVTAAPPLVEKRSAPRMSRTKSLDAAVANPPSRTTRHESADEGAVRPIVMNKNVQRFLIDTIACAGAPGSILLTARAFPSTLLAGFLRRTHHSHLSFLRLSYKRA